MNPLNSIKLPPPFLRRVGFIACVLAFSPLFAATAFARATAANYNAKLAYYEFLTGQKPVHFYGEERFIDDFGSWVPSYGDRYYVLLDVNGDGIDECFITGTLLFILISYERGALTFLPSGDGGSTDINRILNDGSLFVINDHMYRVYSYFVWRDGGYVKECWFFEPTRVHDLYIINHPEESDNEPYEINGRPVTDEEFETFTRPIFAIGWGKVHMRKVKDFYDVEFHAEILKSARLTHRGETLPMTE